MRKEKHILLFGLREQRDYFIIVQIGIIGALELSRGDADAIGYRLIVEQRQFGDGFSVIGDNDQLFLPGLKQPDVF